MPARTSWLSGQTAEGVLERPVRRVEPPTVSPEKQVTAASRTADSRWEAMAARRMRTAMRWASASLARPPPHARGSPVLVDKGGAGRGCLDPECDLVSGDEGVIVLGRGQ